MRFEERVRILCARALTACDEAEVRDALTDLRALLHQHIQQIREELRVVYLKTPPQPGIVPFVSETRLQNSPEPQNRRRIQRLMRAMAREERLFWN
jgi:hypothetical protein